MKTILLESELSGSMPSLSANHRCTDFGESLTLLEFVYSSVNWETVPISQLIIKYKRE